MEEQKILEAGDKEKTELKVIFILAEKAVKGRFGRIETGPQTRQSWCGEASNILWYSAKINGWEAYIFRLDQIQQALAGLQVDSIGETVDHAFVIMVSQDGRPYLGDITIEQFLERGSGKIAVRDECFGQKIESGATSLNNTLLADLYLNGYIPLNLRSLREYVSLFSSKPVEEAKLRDVLMEVREALPGVDLGADKLQSLFSSILGKPIKDLPEIGELRTDFEKKLGEIPLSS